MPIDRRRFLGSLALAPAALAGCAGAASSRSPGALARGSGQAAAVPPGGAGAADALRAYPLARDAEPALVFRAAAARPGER